MVFPIPRCEHHPTAMSKPTFDSVGQADFQADDFSSSPPPKPPPIPGRLASIDAYRGLVMFLMMAEVLQLCRVASKMSSNWVWDFLCYHQTHVEWIGCSLHDMIQPSFSFLVGVALPFSMASRLARGSRKAWMTAHAVWRSLILVFLGVFLRSRNSDQTNFTFEDTLSQIGMGYTFLFVLAFFSTRVQWLALAAILVGYWGLFAAYPLPGPDFDYTKVGVPASWPHHLTGSRPTGTRIATRRGRSTPGS